MRKLIILICISLLCNFTTAQDFVIKQDNTSFVREFVDYNFSKDKLTISDISEQRYNIKIDYASFEKIGHPKHKVFNSIMATFVLLERRAGIIGQQLIEDLKQIEKPMQISLGSVFGAAGIYDPEKDRIEVSNLRDDIKEILIHESRHYIQNKKAKALGYSQLDRDISKIVNTKSYYLNAYVGEADAFAYQYTISEIAKPHMYKNLQQLLELEDYNLEIADNGLELLSKNFESFFDGKNYIINTAFKTILYGTHDNNVKFYFYTKEGYQQSDKIFHHMKVSLRIDDVNYFFKKRNATKEQVCAKPQIIDMSKIILAYTQVGDKNYLTDIPGKFANPTELSEHILYSFDKFLKRKLMYSLDEREELLQEFCSRF